MPKKTLLILFSLAFALLLCAFCLQRSTGVANNGQTRCCDGSIQLWHSSTLPVRILIDEAGSPQAPGALTHNAIRAAINTWNQVRSSHFRFADDGLTDQKTISGTDGKNVVIFDRAGTYFPQGSGAVAFSRTFTRTDNLGYRAIDSDLVYNSRDWQFEANPSFASLDIQSIALHELGHHLGLDHAGGGRDLSGPGGASTGCGPVIPGATMFYAIRQGDTSSRTLDIDDIGGITAIYPKWTIAGAVFDNSTGQPFLNTTVKLEGTRSPLDTIIVNSGNTGETGFFTLPLLDSIATISVCQFGYKSNVVTMQFTKPEPEVKPISLGMDLLPQGELAGRIADQTNSTGIEAEVILYAEGKEFRRTAAGADGRYSIADIPSSDPPCTGYDSLKIRPLLNYPQLSLNSIQVNAGATTEYNFQLVPAEVAIIDDDGGQNSETKLISSLSRLKHTYFEWDVSERGSPAPIIDRLQPRYLLWTTSSAIVSALDTTAIQKLVEFLNRGNHLLLSGTRLASQIESTDFFRNVLHARRSGATTARVVRGIAGDPIGNELFIGLLDAGEKDLITTDGNQNAATALQYTNNVNEILGGAGIHFAGQYKVAYFSFDFNSILDGNPNLSSSDKVLENVLKWFGLSTGVEDRQRLAEAGFSQQFQLFPNYPNPFRQADGHQQTAIKYTVANSSRKAVAALQQVQLAVYDLLGRRLATLVDAPQAPGDYTTTWNGQTDTGQFAGAGVYFYVLRVGETRLTKKMIIF